MKKKVQITLSEKENTIEVVNFYKSVNENIYIDMDEIVLLAKEKSSASMLD
jgi:hypothetical protein